LRCKASISSALFLRSWPLQGGNGRGARPSVISKHRRAPRPRSIPVSLGPNRLVEVAAAQPGCAPTKSIDELGASCEVACPAGSETRTSDAILGLFCET
jgi:hypothetical protein